jgi:hypothetical protein
MTHRTGNCFDDCFNKVTNPFNDDGFEWTMVHGMPLGAGGLAAKAGRYPHAWLERTGPHGEILVEDPNTRGTYPAEMYYRIGRIVAEDCIRYTRKEAIEAAMESGTSGPWAKVLLERDEEIEAIFAEEA